MVEIAEAGSLIIRGEMDTSNIEAGFSRVKSHFDTTREKSSSLASDLQRISSVAQGLAKSMIAMGTASAGVLVGLAKDAPAVAPALAQMDMNMTKLKYTIGEALAPAFQQASDLFNDFVNEIQNTDSQSFLSGFGEGFIGFFKTAYDLINDALDKYKEFKKAVLGEGSETTSTGTEGRGSIGSGGVSLETEGKILGGLTAGGISYFTLNKLTGGGLNKLVKWGISGLKDVGNGLLEGLGEAGSLTSTGTAAIGSIAGTLGSITFNPFVDLLLKSFNNLGFSNIVYVDSQRTKGENFNSYVISV